MEANRRPSSASHALCISLFLLPEVTFQAHFVPTIEGQYTLKDGVFVALACTGFAPQLLPPHAATTAAGWNGAASSPAALRHGRPSRRKSAVVTPTA
jgi:hypothetical protein